MVFQGERKKRSLCVNELNKKTLQTKKNEIRISDEPTYSLFCCTYKADIWGDCTMIHKTSET